MVLRWLKKTSKEISSDIIRALIVNKIIIFLSAIHFTLIGTFLKNNYLILMLITLNMFIWFRLYKKNKVNLTKNDKPLPEISEIPREQAFISLGAAILELNKNEDVLGYCPTNLMEPQEFMADYHIHKYLGPHIYGNKIILQTMAEEKTRITNNELPSRRTPSGGYTSAGNKWGDNYNALYASSGNRLYDNLSISTESFKKIKEKQKDVIAEKDEVSLV